MPDSPNPLGAHGTSAFGSIRGDEDADAIVYDGIEARVHLNGDAHSSTVVEPDIGKRITLGDLSAHYRFVCPQSDLRNRHKGGTTGRPMPPVVVLSGT